jgi:hypothetical protein
MKNWGICKVLKLLIAVQVIFFTWNINSVLVLAKGGELQISGQVCEFGEKEEYDLSFKSNDTKTYGSLIVDGETYSISSEDGITKILIREIIQMKVQIITFHSRISMTTSL